MKYNIQIFATKKGINLNQNIDCKDGNWSSLQDLLDEYAHRYYKHKTHYNNTGNETKCMIHDSTTAKTAK